MKNLSLPSVQALPVKVLADSPAKADARPDMNGLAASKPSFKATLNNQIQSRQNQLKQADNKPATMDKKTVASAKDAPAVKADTAEVADDKSLDAGKKALELNAQLAAELLASSQSNNESAVVLQAPAQDTATTTVNADVLAAMMAAAMPAANKVLTTQTDASPVDAGQAAAADVGSADFKLLPTATVPQVAIDSTQVKTASTGNVAFNATPEQPKFDGETAAEHARWLDAVLPNVAKQTAGTERATELAGSDPVALVSKDKVSTEAMLPVNLPSTANTSLAMQQVASSNNISAYPGKAGWDQALSQKVVWMVGAGEQSATLTLNPPDLGPLQVVIHVHNDQADTTFISDNAEVRQALEDGISNLRNKMSESGVQLGQTNVSTSGQSQNAFQQSAQSQARSVSGAADVGDADLLTARSQPLTRVSNGLVDTFA